MIRNRVITEWKDLKKLFAAQRKVNHAEKEINKMIPVLEDKINNLNIQNQLLSQEKRDLTDKLLIYKECFVIAEKKEPSQALLSHSGQHHRYPEWHDSNSHPFPLLQKSPLALTLFYGKVHLLQNELEHLSFKVLFKNSCGRGLNGVAVCVCGS